MNSIPNDLIYAAGILIAGAIGSLATWYRMRGAERRGERKGIRQMENLLRARAIQDLRDSQRLF
jgi:hypothetical protein